NDFNGSLTSLNFKEVGPYVFDEIRSKKNFEFDKDLDTVSYEEDKSYVFNPALSGKGLLANDTVTVIYPILFLPNETLSWAGTEVKNFTIQVSVEKLAFHGTE